MHGDLGHIIKVRNVPSKENTGLYKHLAAYRSSQYLQLLLQYNVIIPEASERLNDVYKTQSIIPPALALAQSDASSSTINTDSTSSRTHSDHETDLLLTRDAVPKLLEVFGVESSSSAAVDLCRAIEQARVRVESGKDGL